MTTVETYILLSFALLIFIGFPLLCSCSSLCLKKKDKKDNKERRKLIQNI